MTNLGVLGRVLAELVVADAPALCFLNCSFNSLGDAGLVPLVEALPRNCHLQKLGISGNDTSEPFMRLVRTFLVNHASLRELNGRDSTTLPDYY